MIPNKKQYFGGLDKNYFAGVEGKGGVNPYVTHTDSFKAAQLGAKGAPKTPKPQYTKEQLDSMRADAYVARNIDAGPQINYEDYQSLPDTIFNGIESWKNSTSAQIGYNMAVQQDMGQTDFIGRAGKAGNINILKNQILTGVPNELKGLNSVLEGYNEAADTGLLSSTMDPNLKMFYSDLASGKNIIDTRVENGNVIVNHATMGEISMNQITKEAQENIVYKNYDTGNIMRKNLSSAYDRGRVLNPTEEALQRSQLNQKLSQQRKGGVVSAAFDDVMGFGTPLLNKSEYQKEFDILTKPNQDPAAVAEAQKILQDAVVDAYITKMNDLAQQGYDSKNGIKRDEKGNIIKNVNVPPGDTKNSNDIQSWYKSHDFGDGSMVNFGPQGNVTGYNMNIDPTKPAVSDLGLQLADMGYILEKEDDVPGTIMFKGINVDNTEQGIDSVIGLDYSPYRRKELAKEVAEKGDKQLAQQLNSLPSKWKDFTPEQKKLYVNAAANVTPGTTGDFTVRPKEGSTASDRQLFRIPINPNDPNSVQSAINKLAKLNL